MGYRLELSKTKYYTCCGKLYGYVDDEKKLESYQWLLKNGYIDGNEVWSYGFNPNIVLKPEKFKEFIELYKKEYNEIHNNNFLDDEKLDELANGDDKILLEWC